MTSTLGRGRLLAVIPAYNEQGAIRRVAAGVREVLPEADVLVVDDGSSDRTMEEAEAAGVLVVRHPFNLGIGATVQTGLRFACEALRHCLIRPGARLYTLPLGHTFLNNSDGTFGYYLKRVDGAVMESYNPTFAFYPASTIKVVQHLHAMRAVDAGTVTLNGTNLNVCSGGTNCTDNANTAVLCGGSMVVETLQTALTNMMRPSNNQSTNAIQELFGAGTPSAGRAAMNQTAWNTVGMSNSTALQHKFACGNVANNPYNTATLADLGLLYEEVMTNDAVLPEPERTTFVQIMLNDTNDGSLVTAINAIVDQEAALIEMPAADIQAFKNGLQFAHKAGNIGTAYESDAGWVSLPVNNGLDVRQYVFGHFLDAATVNTLPSFDARTAELLRTAIRESLPLY